MKNLINNVSFVALTVIRVFIFLKMAFLLYVTFTEPQNYKITEMGWFLCFMIFDMWLLIVVKFTIPTKEEIDEEMNK